MIYLVDLDGTVADLTHRLHFIEKEPVDWDAFFACCDGDTPIQSVITTVNLLHDAGALIACVTGRTDAIRRPTQKWLVENDVRYDMLYMRRTGDHRPDNLVKAELYERIKAEFPSQEIIAVFEDRQQVVDMYRAKGLTVYQVAEGNF